MALTSTNVLLFDIFKIKKSYCEDGIEYIAWFHDMTFETCGEETNRHMLFPFPFSKRIES